MTFNDRNITYTGELTNYDYQGILRNKQGNINKLYELADYFTDADPLYRGMIKGVYTPFTIAQGYRLIGANEQTKRKYEAYYDRIELNDKMQSIFLQYYKYGNVYCYLMEDGDIITLPPHKCRISNMALNGEPLVEYNVRSIRDDLVSAGVKAVKGYIDDEILEERLKGFPPEVIKGVKDNVEYVQLNPANTFVLQDLKEEWTRYAIPMVATCLTAFQKKALIQQYETSQLNLGLRGFLHAKYGDPTHTSPLPDRNQLMQTQSLFRSAMTGSALAVTNHWVSAEFITADTDKLFEFDKYKDVNNDILAGGGISGIIVSGVAGDGSTFATAQVSMQTAALRIRTARNNFAQMMNKINQRVNGILPHSKSTNIPKFTFPPVDLAGDAKFQEACTKLWQSGVMSTQTMMEAYGLDTMQEVERRKNEAMEADEILAPRTQKNEEAVDDGEKNEGGRPEMTDEERNSDPANSQTGKQPKPSNPEGSL